MTCVACFAAVDEVDCPAVPVRFRVTRFFFTGAADVDEAFVLCIESISFCRVLSVVVMLRYLVDQLIDFRDSIYAATAHVEYAAPFECAVSIDRTTLQCAIRDR